MKTCDLLPAKFDSNIYIARQLSSEKLDSLIHFRLFPDQYQNPITDLAKCDELLQMEISNFEKLKTMIDLEETLTFRFGNDTIDNTFFSL